MNGKKLESKRTATVAGILVGGVLLSANAYDGVNSYSYDVLGTGSELRSELLNQNTISANTLTLGFEKDVEAKCGEGTCGGDHKNEKKKKKSKKSKDKVSEHKCGEGKCGKGKCDGEKKEDTEKKSSEKGETATEKESSKKDNTEESHTKSEEKPTK